MSCRIATNGRWKPKYTERCSISRLDIKICSNKRKSNAIRVGSTLNLSITCTKRETITLRIGKRARTGIRNFHLWNSNLYFYRCWKAKDLRDMLLSHQILWGTRMLTLIVVKMIKRKSTSRNASRLLAV